MFEPLPLNGYQEQFVIEYQDLKNKFDKIFFMDSTHPQHNAILSHGWIRKGEEKEILTKIKYVNLMKEFGKLVSFEPLIRKKSYLL